MKKIVLIVIAVTLTFFSAIGASADQIIGNVYQVENVSVIFDADSQLTLEEQERIVQLLVNPEYGVTQANIICNIFGHKNSSEGVSTVTHKVSATDPRCLEEFFTITMCSRCEETTVERNGMRYIPCCPED